ncbi:hypothetical protein VCR12J2_1030171 [Vibrio coralliirubri]|nr:hypothetical protein VCR12J2_1030171 [Vibrio coralliirubri]
MNKLNLQLKWQLLLVAIFLLSIGLLLFNPKAPLYKFWVLGYFVNKRGLEISKPLLKNG